MDADGYTLNYTTAPASARIVYALAFGAVAAAGARNHPAMLGGMRPTMSGGMQ